jgi:uncharacterized membrane protein
MDLSDLFLLLIRWIHNLAAVAWVGGSLFFLLVLRPALRSSPDAIMLNRIAGQEFRNLVDTAIWVLLVTGAILAINRLTSGNAGTSYGVVLGTKIALSVWMFYLVWFRQRRTVTVPTPQPDQRPPAVLRLFRAASAATNLLLILGVLVLLLSDILRGLFEQAIAA